MSCQCYQVGGPFIAEDPDCPLHGANAPQAMSNDTERAAIVAWLRGKVAGFHAAAQAQGKKVGVLAAGYSSAANAIERGDHLTPTLNQEG